MGLQVRKLLLAAFDLGVLALVRRWRFLLLVVCYGAELAVA